MNCSRWNSLKRPLCLATRSVSHRLEKECKDLRDGDQCGEGEAHPGQGSRRSRTCCCLRGRRRFWNILTGGRDQSGGGGAGWGPVPGRLPSGGDGERGVGAASWETDASPNPVKINVDLLKNV